jgi:glycosyltransferase involved in cell wall biosynthesis
VCQVLHSLTVGGAEMLAYQLARGLRDRFQFVFACLDEIGLLGSDLQRQGFRVVHLGRKSGFDPGCARRLAAFARETGSGLIHAHQYTPFFYSLAPVVVRRRPPVLFTEHGRWFPDYRRWKRVVFNRWALRRSDRVVGVGRSVRQALVHNEGIPADRVGVIYNGVALENVAEHTVYRHEVRRELRLRENELAIIQVARLDHLKDHLTAARTICRVARERPEARLLLVGEGPERKSIEEEIRRNGLEPFIRFLGLRTDVPRLLAAADMFLLTSISEGIPVTLIEAMAGRLPVVATDVGGVAEVVAHDITGLLAPAGDDEALATHVIRLAADRPLGRRLGDEGYRRAARLFSQQRMHEEYARMYAEMILARHG